ncbi:hypothetical protein RDWZM_006412 [Blomia tropicalis]|uniref:Peptidase S72 domain-containing protein n=1 Tax=Blomia tropicalis TaxID=40697 RepID=A0A9Q0RNJ2_BLOTA|nr:hypothetical protein RDWZM_006412 [Blomia tropicalis]
MVAQMKTYNYINKRQTIFIDETPSKALNHTQRIGFLLKRRWINLFTYLLICYIHISITLFGTISANFIDESFGYDGKGRESNGNKEDVFQISDQQAFLGKLFYHSLRTPSNLHNLTLIQAGYDHLDGEQTKLPSWLYFNQETGELFGAPLEKKIYFIQVAATIDDQSDTKYEDIFVIEVIDPPGYLLNQKQSFNHHQNGIALFQCRIELKHSFNDIGELYQTVAALHGSFGSHHSRENHHHSGHDLREWLQRFTIIRGSSSKSWKIFYEVEKCGSTIDKFNQRDHVYLDQHSEKLLSRLAELRIESELIKIASPSLLDEIARLQPSTTTSEPEIRPIDNRKMRRNAYVEDSYATPTLSEDWKTLTTSTIDLNADFILSRTLIPSMISPTFTGGDSTVQATPAFNGNDGSQLSSSSQSFRQYPRLYSTPVLLPDTSSLLLNAHGIDGQILATPVMPSPAYTSSSFPSITPQQPAMPDTSSTSSTTTSTSTTPASTTSTESTPPPLTIKPNHRPFVNRRIAKLSITAGKYWQYTIPENTFLDIEDGDTRKLRLAFFKDSELPPVDYWIQFNHENQYLYALPTEENIGKYRFNLVAIDSQGVEVSETLEIYVRQPRESLTFTHKYTFANVFLNLDNFLERIDAVSKLLERMAIQIFDEALGDDLSETMRRQTILHSISVLSIRKNENSNLWNIVWTNDTLRRHPCPVNEINNQFSKLYDVTYPEDQEGFMTPSLDLINTLTPEFKVQKIKREFIGRSACGSYAIAPGSGLEGFDPSRHKEKIVFSNRINRLGPYKLGEPFRFQVPSDTVYSVKRQVDTRDLVLNLAPVEPEIDLPEFLYFDVREQTIYGMPYKPEHVHTYELQLIAEDPIVGGRESDVFAIDIIHDVHTREDYLFEVTMSFLIRNVEKLASTQLRLSPKDHYQVAHHIATRLMFNSNLDAIRMLEINRYRFTKISEEIIGDTGFTSLIEDPNSPKQNENLELLKTHSTKKRRRSYHNLRFRRNVDAYGGPDYFYEFVWTNRSLVTQVYSSANVYGGGTVSETIGCPSDQIHSDVYDRLFPSSATEFLANVKLDRNGSHMDVMEIYTRLFESVEANVEFLSIEWQPKSVCSVGSGLEHRIFGAKPIHEPDDDSSEDDGSAQPTQVSTNAPEPPLLSPDDGDIELLPAQTYLGDKLLTVIIPPIAILTALLFAVTIGCCFHRANLRRKAMGTAMQDVSEESPNLYRQRIPIQFEFERGGVRATETEAMLGQGRNPVQIMPMRRGIGQQQQLYQQGPIASHQGGRMGRGPQVGHHMPYSMVPQQ